MDLRRDWCPIECWPDADQTEPCPDCPYLKSDEPVEVLAPVKWLRAIVEKMRARKRP